MTGRRLTILGLSLAAGALVVVEALALRSREKGDTISAVAADGVSAYPALAGLMVAPVVHFATPPAELGTRPPWYQTLAGLVGGALLGYAWRRYDRSDR